MSGNHVARRSHRFGTAAVLAATTVLVGLGLVAAAVRPGWQVRYRTFDLPRPTPRFTPPPPPSFTAVPAPPRETSTAGQTVVAVLLVVLIAVGVAVVGLLVFVLVRWLRRRLAAVEVTELEDRETRPQLPVLRRGAEEAERRLLRGGDPTDAILTAWLALEEAASSSGVPRQPSETPTEFTVAVVERTGIDPTPIRELLRLYHRARFTAAGAPAGDIETARRCVAEIAAAWRAFDLDADTGATAGSAGSRTTEERS
ncbi:hypothetical protein FHX74_002350 [Friedmanniella endophytica]|uniref:Protein-glutamine gamma-glutamyltransferase-like C-terminal domain-containing protein n=1 Tax=Microlunatus kandeliicorticis TaxID=1759536 RepID=A0A7W3P666_9ACTN|nr:DUF4129 domain-containing protein [Microlunatus kandeliicorticis]MBA8794731.1 hypothetical protein [Microlunatus kandeliicorticis]